MQGIGLEIQQFSEERLPEDEAGVKWLTQSHSPNPEVLSAAQGQGPSNSTDFSKGKGTEGKGAHQTGDCVSAARVLC